MEDHLSDEQLDLKASTNVCMWWDRPHGGTDGLIHALSNQRVIFTFFFHILKALRVIREDILPHSQVVPRDFLSRIMTLLNKGSIHSATNSALEGKWKSGSSYS